MEAGGLFKERVFEIAEMREEPVVTKIAVVHEEVIVRKIVKERTETIRDSVRQTQVEVEDLPLPEEEGPGLFGSDKRGGR
jgi:stress response protein YsnF